MDSLGGCIDKDCSKCHTTGKEGVMNCCNDCEMIAEDALTDEVVRGCKRPMCPCHIKPKKQNVEEHDVITELSGYDDHGKCIFVLKSAIRSLLTSKTLQVEARVRKEVGEQNQMYHSQGESCCYLNPCGCVCHADLKERIK